jgi:hypothetical protein
MFILPFYRVVCVSVALVSAAVIRKIKISNTLKLLLFLGLQVVLVHGALDLMDFAEKHYGTTLMTYRIDSDVLKVLNTELQATKQWFIDNHYLFVSFTLSVLTSRFIDILSI